MKKFVFTNESYRKIKNDEYDRLKRELENVDREIEELEAQIQSIEARIEAERIRQDRDCEEGVTVEKLMQYQNCYAYMRDARKTAEEARDTLRLTREALQQELLKLHNQLRVLDEMREEQYAEYLKEVEKEEAKDMDTVLSFNIHEGAG